MLSCWQAFLAAATWVLVRTICGGASGYQPPDYVRTNVVLKLYPTLNHLFAEGHGKATPAEYAEPKSVAEFVVADIAAWILAR